MGSGLAQAIRRGAAAGASVVGARGLQSAGGSPGRAHVADVAGRGGGASGDVGAVGFLEWPVRELVYLGLERSLMCCFF